MRRVFLLSPAHSGGKRAQMLVRPEAQFALARRLRAGEPVTLGEVFTFLSGLYFRGKLAYAEAFAQPPPGVPRALVITPSHGLLSARAAIGLEHLRAFASVEVDAANARYRTALIETAEAFCREAEEVVLLGSIATEKYCGVLLPLFGERLVFPADFVGRGDMSRGALMLRAAASGQELTYTPVAGALRHGARAPRISQAKPAAKSPTIPARTLPRPRVGKERPLPTQNRSPFPMLKPSLLILADRGTLKAYALESTATRGPLPRLLESFQLADSHGRAADRYTDRAGSFPNGGSRGEGNSIAEQHGLAAETDQRIFRELGHHIASLLHQHRPEHWGFAAPSEINGAIMKELEPALHKTLAVNVQRDLVKTDAADLAGYFLRAVAA